MSVYIELFLAFLQIGAFSFGGGYAAMPLIQDRVIKKYNWLSISDFADLVTIAEMTPGPIAVNAASFVGNQVAGIPGAVISTIGVIMPSCFFVSALSFLYMKYRSLSLMQGVLRAMRPAVVSMIFIAGLNIMLPAFFHKDGIGAIIINYRGILYFIIAIIELRRFKINAIIVMLSTGIFELIASCIML